MKTKKVKISIAIFFVIFIVGFSAISWAQEESESDTIIFLDTDQDGLNDEEEATYGTDPHKKDTDGDGYSDGSEIKSGYDPLKPAPGDKIIKDGEEEDLSARGDSDIAEEGNLTSEISKELVGLISGGEQIDISSLDSLINETVGEKVEFEDLPEINEEDIKIKKQDYDNLSEEKRKAKEKEDAMEYLTATAYLALSNSPYEINSLDDIEGFMDEVMSQASVFSLSLNDISYFDKLAEKGEDSLEQLNEIEVPEDLLDLHKKGLQIANYAIGLRSETRPDSQDPIATIAGLSKIQGLLVLSLEFSKEVESRIKELGITELPLNL